ncbi:MAG: leucine-rich repeat domain-containing protein [Candidatus Thorarchaeota archaeon]|nr:leucine-rich repeat domain-containing protein [Candidatus Thorarchaeota archaeon]
MVSEIFIRYETTTGLEKTARFRTDETSINLDLRDITIVDLLPLIWCENLETLCLRNNSLIEIDLSPLEKCGKKLRSIRLNNNRLQDIDFGPLSFCPDLEEVSLEHNRLKRVDLSPLFQCANLKELVLDKDVGLTADLLLRSVGSWPEVLVEQYHRILWKSDSLR